MPRSSKPKSRLQQLREQIVKMGGDDIAPKFETLQLHAGMHFSLLYLMSIKTLSDNLS